MNQRQLNIFVVVTYSDSPPFRVLVQRSLLAMRTNAKWTAPSPVDILYSLLCLLGVTTPLGPGPRLRPDHSHHVVSYFSEVWKVSRKKQQSYSPASLVAGIWIWVLPMPDRLSQVSLGAESLEEKAS